MNDPAIQELLARTPHISQDEVLAHPRFPEARKLYLDRFLAVYGDDLFLVRLLIETGRFLVFHLAIILQASHDPARRETLFTVGRLKQHMATFGLGASERQVDHLISRLCAVGFMEVLRSDEDRRVRILRPTERMLAHDRDWLAAHYAPLCSSTEPPAIWCWRRFCTPPCLIPPIRTPRSPMPTSATVLAYRAPMCASSWPRRRKPVWSSCRRAAAIAWRSFPALWASYDRAIAGGMFFHDLIHGAATGRRALAATGT